MGEAMPGASSARPPLPCRRPDRVAVEAHASIDEYLHETDPETLIRVLEALRAWSGGDR